jgi:hypothetical protein
VYVIRRRRGLAHLRHLTENYQATILWLGRSAMTPAIAAKVEDSQL